jgi:hypothetical protein
MHGAFGVERALASALPLDRLAAIVKWGFSEQIRLFGAGRSR